ncbi:MAG TPA: T9SS type A sorting domain-containing protein [Ignavibacteria bacterium]|nr:T9SS type A sorting domain-containing protein [Ignavibacteria bacterium]
MKQLTIILLIIFWGRTELLFSQQQISPEELGLKIHYGKIDFSKLSSRQKDTIAINLFTIDDSFMDIAVYQKSKSEIVIYKNLGNGYLELYKSFPVSKEVRKIEATIKEDYPIYLPPAFDLKILYSDGEEYILENKKINSSGNNDLSKAPLRNFLDDPKIFLYEFEFIKTWESFRNGQPVPTFVAGDVDNDGRNELIYTFYPVNDSAPQFIPARIVIFENYGNNLYRKDWDTTLASGGGAGFVPHLTDFDRNGQKEFFAVAYDAFSNVNITGLYECKGEGKYLFYTAGEFFFQGALTDVVLVDTMKIINNSRNAGIWVNYYPSGFPSNFFNKIQAYIYTGKSDIPGFLGFYFQNADFGPNGIRLNNDNVYDIEVYDIDEDGKDEIVLGNTIFGTGGIEYLDSTGSGIYSGYEYKYIEANAPVSAGRIILKDLDNDSVKEIITCGIGSGSGSIGVIKHTGLPGENLFQTMWWDTNDIFAAPNRNSDSNTINDKFTILYPYVFPSPTGSDASYYFNTYALNGIYSFNRTSKYFGDSAGSQRAILIDMDKDNKMSIISAIRYDRFVSGNTFLTDYEIGNSIGISNFNIGIAENHKLFQNYPNPFNPNTKIKFSIGKDNYLQKQDVKIKVFDILGKEVKTLVNEQLSEGSYETEFNASNFMSGIYFYTLTINNKLIQTNKMLFIK